jgi:hypothetical protein
MLHAAARARTLRAPAACVNLCVDSEPSSQLMSSRDQRAWRRTAVRARSRRHERAVEALDRSLNSPAPAALPAAAPTLTAAPVVFDDAYHVARTASLIAQLANLDGERELLQAQFAELSAAVHAHWQTRPSRRLRPSRRPHRARVGSA